MNWRDRANSLRPFYLGRDVERLAGWRRREAAPEVDRMIDEGFPSLLIDRGVALINAYHEAGETDEAFEALCGMARDLAVASARLAQSWEAIDDLILRMVRDKVELMYDEGTAERLMVAFERGLGSTGRPMSWRN